MTWNDFWFGAKELPFWAFSIRAIILYSSLIIATRFMRQRQISILSGHNHLVAAGIVSLAAVRMVNSESSLVAGIAIVFVYAAINILLSYLDVKFPRKVDRHATVVIENGKIIRKNLKDVRITIDNLLSQLRLKNVFSLSEVLYAVVEPTGKINVVKSSQSLSLTRKQMGLPLKNVSVPTILIYDGKVQNDNLKMLGYDIKWLDARIKEKGIANVEDIFLAQLEADGIVYISV
ncbi:MAG: YetF domain-containing protein [Bacillota bacterium]